MSKRRRHSAETKLQVVREALETGNGALVARRQELSASMVSRWVREYRKYGEPAFRGGNSKAVAMSNKGYYRLEDENERLKKILGEKELEVAILRDLLKKQNPHRQTK